MMGTCHSVPRLLLKQALLCRWPVTLCGVDRVALLAAGQVSACRGWEWAFPARMLWARCACAPALPSSRPNTGVPIYSPEPGQAAGAGPRTHCCVWWL